MRIRGLWNEQTGVLTRCQTPNISYQYVYSSCTSKEKKELALKWYECKIQKSGQPTLNWYWYSIMTSTHKLATLLQEPCFQAATVGKSRTGRGLPDTLIESGAQSFPSPTKPRKKSDESSSHIPKQYTYDEDKSENVSLKTQQKERSSQNIVENPSTMEAIYNVKHSLQNKKQRIDDTTKDLTTKRRDLQKAINSVQIQTRSIVVCKREIDNHCCQCGGIHIFSDHERTQRKECKRLKNKTRSLMYLKQALRDSSESVILCQVAVDNGEVEVNTAQASMAEALSIGLFRLESLSGS